MNTIQMLNLFNATKDSSLSVTNGLIVITISLVLGAIVLGVMEWLLNR